MITITIGQLWFVFIIKNFFYIYFDGHEHIQFVRMHLIWLRGRRFHLFPYQFWSHTMLVIIMKTKTSSMRCGLLIFNTNNEQNVILFILLWWDACNSNTIKPRTVPYWLCRLCCFFPATSSNSLYLLLKSDYGLIPMKRNFLLVIIFILLHIFSFDDLTGWICLFARRWMRI